jgi:hypothetical protein
LPDFGYCTWVRRENQLPFLRLASVGIVQVAR